jgi:hypothetical protein
VFALGKVSVGLIHDWVPSAGSVVSWQGSGATLAKAKPESVDARSLVIGV